MITLAAPAELPEVTVTLPSPDFGDGRSPLVTVESKRSMDNTQYTYVKRKGRERLTYSLIISLPKQQELQAFVARFLTNWWRLVDHEGSVWRVRLVSQPLTFTQKDRGNRGQVQLILEGSLEGAATLPC